MNENWEEEAREAFERFLRQMKEELPEGSSFAEIEEQMMELEDKLMEEVIQARSSAGGIFPPDGKCDTRKSS
jgi:type II secretory pathway component PulF